MQRRNSQTYTLPTFLLEFILIYNRDDLAEEGTHPSQASRHKVVNVMLEFFKNDPLAKTWFLK